MQLTRYPSCPTWCAGHYGGDAGRHWSEATNVGRLDAPRHAVSVSLAAWNDEEPQVFLVRHRAHYEDSSFVDLGAEDARALAEVLDGVHAAELADAIRTTLARLNKEA